MTTLGWLLEGGAAAALLVALGLRLRLRRRSRIVSSRGRALVREADGQRELWLVDGPHATLQSRVRLDDGLVTGVPYTDGFHLYAPASGRALFVGAGAALTPRQLVAFHPGLHASVVDDDPDVLATAGAWFGLVSGPQLETEIADGRAALERPGAWDFIVIDAFGAGDFPARLATVELFRLARDRLAPGGVLAVNLAGTLDGPVLRGVVAGIVQAFGAERTQLFGVPEPDRAYETARSGNTLAFGFRDEVPAVRLPAHPRLPWLSAIAALRLEELPTGAALHDGDGPARLPIV